MTIVSGDDQAGESGDFLSAPFVVLVADRAGKGIAGVRVTWAVAAGEGDFRMRGDVGARPVSSTGADGLANIYFRPTWPGPTLVDATAMGAFSGSPATFHVSGAPVALIKFGPMFDCTESDPSLFDEPESFLPYGTVVVWEYMDWVHPACAARIVSRSVPPGGSPFDSGILHPGERFWIVPDVAGDWQFEDVINQGMGSVRVR